MKIYYDLADYKSDQKTFVTIGTFDGVHIGHQKVIRKLVNSAKEENAGSLLLTFFPHPRMILQQNKDIKLINTIEERIQLLHKTGLDILVIQEFTSEYAEQTAEDFVKNKLVKKLHLKHLVIGYDHHFGKNREGNFEQLVTYGKEFGFKVNKISKKEIEDIAISSTKIRKAIINGDIEKANRYLGYHFMLNGTVEKGRNLGEKIGFPTANLSIKEAYKLIPKTGAYIVKSKLNNKTVFGMMNIGYRPTVKGEHKTIEIHFFDFSENLYGKCIKIEVLKFLREEQKFESVTTLQKQLEADQKKCLEFIGTFVDSY